VDSVLNGKTINSDNFIRHLKELGKRLKRVRLRMNPTQILLQA
jgi:hypothetical protein